MTVPANVTAGSSPLARGLPRQTRSTQGASWDHPRSRGVYLPTRQTGAGSPGSSPLARGLPAFAPGGIWDAGIIPARAGFTSTPAFPASKNGDHPRSRGVYRRPESPDRPAAGSSPLARGLLVLNLGLPNTPRIIPARAGFTFNDGTSVLLIQDHPRSRGVYRTRNRRVH